MRSMVVLLALFCAGLSLQAQEQPHNPVFSDPIANPFEARIGSMYQVSDERLRLDIGASMNWMRDTLMALGVSDLHVELGADFMTWSRLRVETNFKFPVETIDYWFGVHANIGAEGSPWQGRVRVAHISSHVVDGALTSSGRLVPEPFVYSREFVEVLIAHRPAAFPDVRFYGGMTAVWATQPDDCDPFIPQAGVDVQVPMGGPWSFYGGNDVRLVGIRDRYHHATAWQAGVKLANANGTGLLLSLYRYLGRSLHGMYYQDFDDYYAVGFQLLL